MESQRIDLWLKLVCLFKHRTDATEACRGGLVKINGRRVKPASVVRAGDVVEFDLGRERRIVALAIPARQTSKEDARTMYRDESPPPPPRGQRPDPSLQRDRGAGRPTKKERRDLEKEFRRK